MYVCDLLGERTGKPLQYSCLENAMNSMKRQKDMTLRAGEDLSPLDGKEIKPVNPKGNQL